MWPERCIIEVEVRHIVFDLFGPAQDARGVRGQVTAFATATSAAMIAQQVAGKAVRDALFLSTFYVKSLPAMMAGAALASLVAAILVSRLLARRAPADVLPVLFGTNAIANGVAWLAFFRAPRVSAVVVYLSMALLGPVILSTFWSLINERFDPHAAKKPVARITAGATLGGVVGGLATWLLSQRVTLSSAIGFLALLNAACVVGALALRRSATNAERTPSLAPGDAAQKTPSPLKVLRGTPFLLALAALMTLGSASSTFLDYALSAKATHLLGSGPQLLAFFSLFGIAVSILSFIVQIVFGKAAIERLGLMANVAALQLLVVGGCAVVLAMPSMASLTLLRGAEMVHRNSLFKSAYELFYTPIPNARRRITKAVIDVGFDRIGTVLGSVATMIVLWRSDREEMRLLWLVALVALASLPVAKWLHSGYVATLEEDLREAEPPPAPVDCDAIGPASARENIIEKIEAVRHPEDRHDRTKVLRDRGEELAARADALLRGDPTAAANALEDWQPHHTVLVPFAATHLADPKLRCAAQNALRSVAREATGALTDILLDTKVAFSIRRRIAPLLAAAGTQRAADGLVTALSDERLEVRYVAGRALLTMTEGTDHGIVLPHELVIRLVQAELARAEEEIEREADASHDDEDPQSSLFDAIARVRVGRRLEHIFDVLALTMEREPLRLAFRCIHHPDERHRGTALEYIQTVLPTEIRSPLWPLLAPDRELLPAPREAADVLAELARVLDEPTPAAP